MSKRMRTNVYLISALCLAAMVSACGGGSSSGSDSDNSSGDGTDLSGSTSENLALVCPNIIDLVPGMNIKYKSQNVHGGRGPSFILGCESNSKQYWPATNYLANYPIFSVKGNEIGRFVVFDHGNRPYGNRSYTGLPGGYPGDSDTLINSALADGSTEIYINVKSNICFKVNNPKVDQGTIAAVGGKGAC